MPASDSIFARLMQVIADRKREPSARSYTASLLAGGVEKIGAKVREEAAEVVEAAAETGPEGQAHFVHEAADLLFHLFVLLGYKDTPLEDVETELERRFGTSGLAEKAARPKSPAMPDPE